MVRVAAGPAEYAHAVVGGGVYGCYVALKLAKLAGRGRVAIVEREADLLMRASYRNQARVHNGYHYPRSMLTGIRSRVNAPRFMREFGGAIFGEFEQCYAIARRRSKVTPGQFEQFCRQIGAPLRPASEAVTALFDEEMIEAVYAVDEYVFDADRLRALLLDRLDAAGVRVFCATEAEKVGAGRAALTLHLLDRPAGARHILTCGQLYNCTYSRLNTLLAVSGLQTILLRHEATEMALIDVPPALENLSVTVMCGPFFSLMPFPARGLATLSHVSYTPHYGWTEDPREGPHTAHEPPFPLVSHFDSMRRDAMRYLPLLRDASYLESLWEVKTILPQSDASDSRPILFKRDPAAPSVVSLLGGKIDNIYDLDDIFAGLRETEPAESPA
jgi:glycine/D-amino acid oxidase-like deaminating enzyme